MANCRECCREISEEDMHNYNGYCKSCYEEIERKKTERESNNINYIAQIIKMISVLCGIIGIFYGLSLLEYDEEMVLPIIVSTVLVSIFFYGFGEIIQLLEDIKNKKD